MVLGYQILMILGDFGGPGVHFGGLEAHFDDILDFCDFKDVFHANPYLVFEVKMRHFLDPIFSVFLSAHFSGFFVILGAQWLQNGSHLEVILMTFLRTGYFLIFATPTVRNLDF